LIYNSTGGKYSGNMTRFIQALLNRQHLPMEDRLSNIGLYPAGGSTSVPQTPIGKNVNRTVFDKNGVKLRIYYTRATGSN
jgi:hypothetical protein